MQNKKNQRGFFTAMAIVGAVLLVGGGVFVLSGLSTLGGSDSRFSSIFSAQILGSDCGYVEKCETKATLTSKRECKDIDVCFDDCTNKDNKCKCESKCKKQNVCRTVKKCEDKKVCKKVYECKPSIKITRPNGKEKIEVGKKFNITWQSKGDVKKVNILLYKGGQYLRDIAKGVSNKNTRYYAWVPEKGIHSGTDYKIRINTDVEGVYGESKEFTLLASPTSISLVSPTGVEKFDPGRNCRISWQYFGDIKEVGIVLYKNGQKIKDIASNVSAGSKTYNWAVDKDLQSGSDYKIRLNTNAKDEDGKDIFSESNNFTILPLLDIKISYPIGKQNLEIGKAYNIVWQMSGDTKAVKSVTVSLFKGGQKVKDIASDLSASIKTAKWTIEKDVVPGDDYKIRVTTDDSRFGESSDYFSINLRSLTVTISYPKGGEKFEIGRNYNLIWQVIGDQKEFNSINIALYKGDQKVKDIASDVPSTQRYFSWKIGDDVSPADDYIIRVSTADGREVYGNSEKFSILPRPSISVVSPNGGEAWKAGEKYEIRWDRNTSASATVRIELYKADKFLRTLLESTSNDSSEFVTLSKTLKVGSDYTVKIIDNSKQVWDTSDSYFKIF